MSATLTTANSSLAMIVEGLYPQAQALQGYAADDAFEADAVESMESSMGIDGKLSVGYVPNPVTFTVTLQADSPSLTIFENIVQSERTNRNKWQIDLTATLPAVGKRYELQKGFLQSYKAPAGKKILQPAVIVVLFESVKFSPFSAT
ncbi:hypothetical protein T2_00015 [Ralstonia phage Elie]|uniref:Uncharacterized protein n=4 Tax=Bakolyvirus TaxID=2843355 RepID=A0A7G5BBP4_9CAUD|nr:virion structural protein [Ralstonia phage Adzire]YP_010052792.1 virion structural protein [Ralstonia phage Bakoly]YP_010077702.1 virion structural protein [Ralstonia phage Simangalove]QMV32960.1 hypothetical protein T2_00015 [Ralstonia phage Elie]QMV33527.1 hypothetical protein 30B_00020 [Ralstonia phage Jenny]QMV33672.1 hypothetical protein S3_00028 [Ralstonia phage Sarlave]QMV32332.1 hypothetical protein S1_00015 [Ralstonia phage Adzire]QMV32616.1 hypothetical protein 2B_00043 [Ralston